MNNSNHSRKNKMIPKSKRQNQNIEDIKSELNKSIKRYEQPPTQDLNDFTDNGIYWYNAGSSNIPEDKYGIILVVSSPAGTKNSTNYWWTVQVACSTNDNIFIRHTTNGTDWSAWSKK
jgi:hypothetical protein